MIRKVIYLGTILLLMSIVSCEKDFQDIGTNVIGNNIFSTNKDTVEISITTLDIDAIRADNISTGDIGEYLLGIYNKPDYKKIEASIIGQLTFLSNPTTEQDDVTVEFDSIYTLDKVFLKIPYVSTVTDDYDDGKPQFLLDSVLGNTTISTPLKIYRNGTYLNTLDPSNPSTSNSFNSDEDFIELEMLNEDANFSFIPTATDTMYVFDRATDTGGVYQDTIKLSETSPAPFLIVPLNKARMKELFWDKFSDAEFSSQSAFTDYFRGIIFKSEGSDGAMIPVEFTGTNAPTLDFYYTITTYDIATGAVQDTIPNGYSFSFSGVKTRKYTATDAVNTPSTSGFPIQGTIGTKASIEILDEAKLAEIREKDWLINDVSLIFHVDESKDTIDAPKQLFLFKKGDPNDTQIKDAYSETSTYGGALELSEDGVPEKYTFRITDYVSDLLNGDTDYNPSLMLKVYNVTTDNAISGFSLDTIVKTYNWNPRAITLLNTSPTNGDKRAKLVISYSEEKK